MNLNFWQNLFLNDFGSSFSTLDTAIQVVAFVVIVFLLPILLYACQKNILRCYQELKRQNSHMQIQSQCLEEINRWMQYIVDKNIHNQKVSPPEKQEPKKNKRPARPFSQGETPASSTPVSPYKKVI